MTTKPRPNHQRYIEILRRMTPEQRKEALGEYRKMQREAAEVGAKGPIRRRLRLR